MALVRRVSAGAAGAAKAAMAAMLTNGNGHEDSDDDAFCTKLELIQDGATADDVVVYIDGAFD